MKIVSLKCDFFNLILALFSHMDDTSTKGLVKGLIMLSHNQDLKINYIKKNATPFSLDTITSDENSVGVLEINGGIADKLKIKDGYKILIAK